jgi:glycosyltransferase involved in cell wall biosynthesis
LAQDRQDKPRVLIIIPAYNESGAIATTLADLAEHFPCDVVVIDDGSSDNTAEIARAHGARVLQLPCNLGVGGAVQTGYQYADQGGYDVAIQFDGDGQHRADTLPGLVAALREGQADLVIGSRRLAKTGFQFAPMRWLGSRLLSGLVSLIVGRWVTDPTSGFRAAGRRTIRFFARHYPQMYLGDTAEALVWAARQGFKLAEVPTQMRARQVGSSTIGNIKGVFQTFRIIVPILVDCLKPRFKMENLP